MNNTELTEIIMGIARSLEQIVICLEDNVIYKMADTIINHLRDDKKWQK